MFAALSAVAAILAAWGVEGQSQTADSNGCLRLLGSVACPGFQYAYINPSNLSNAWPWLAGVTTVAQFDVAALNYFVDPDQWQQTKFVNQLGCTNATGRVIQYERSRLCSNWVNSVWGRACTANYNGTSAATSQKMLCQSTCLQYAASARNLVNSTACPGPDTTNGGREAALLKDYVDCTDWFTLTTNNTQTCVSGQDNEGNCGFGSNTAELCNFCRGNNVDSCCYRSNTDVSVCGYVLPVQASSTSPSASSTGSSSASSSATAAMSDAGSSSTLTGGRLAGAIVGGVLGGLLLLALLALLLLCLRRRRRNAANRHSTSSSFAPAAAGTPGGLSSLFSANSPQPNASEKGLIGNSRTAGMSSPTMGGDTVYSGHNKSALSSGLLGGAGNRASAGTIPGMLSALSLGGAGAGLGAAAGSGAAGSALSGPGVRTSGIVLPRVRDENQTAPDKWIETGAEVSVLWPYQATLPDELDLRPGMKLKVLRLYDDAWGTGVIVGGEDDGKQGAFPVVCVSEGSTLGSSGASSTVSH